MSDLRRLRMLAAALALVTVSAGCGSLGVTTPPSSTRASSSSTATRPQSSPTAAVTVTPTVPATSTTRASLRGTASVLFTGLEVPWGVAFLPDGSALVSERDTARIVRIGASSSQPTVTEVGTVPGVEPAGEGGLLGLAVSPTFASDRLVYAYVTAADDNRILSMRLDDTGLTAPTPVLTGLPKAQIHNGGCIAFGPDGMLYATAGDANQRQRAQDWAYLGGKVLRMTATGQPAPGNPRADSVVYTLGHRNPQGLAWGPDGSLYEAEFGQDTQDEINLLQPGRNYGWPEAEGDTGRTSEEFTPPLRTWSTRDASPSGLAFADGALWLAGLRGQRLYRIPVTAPGRVGEPTAVLEGQFGRLRTVVVAPDGRLWVTTSNRDGRGNPTAEDDRILRIT